MWYELIFFFPIYTSDKKSSLNLKDFPPTSRTKKKRKEKRNLASLLYSKLFNHVSLKGIRKHRFPSIFISVFKIFMSLEECV